MWSSQNILALPIEPVVGFDVVTVVDIGPVVNTGPVVDTGPLVDTGPVVDISPVVDIGPVVDTGPVVDIWVVRFGSWQVQSEQWSVLAYGPQQSPPSQLHI